MYENFFTRANPGLVIFMIDQSASMSQIGYEGRPLAETAADIMNSMIDELTLKFMLGERVRECAHVVIIGYGGTEDSMEAELLCSGSIAQLFAEDRIPVKRFVVMIPDGTGGTIPMDYEIKQYVTPTSVGVGQMSNAFQLASELVKEWLTRAKEGYSITRDDRLDPIPLIINISDGDLVDCEADVLKYANEIMDITIPDGNPLIANILMPAYKSSSILLPTVDELDDLQVQKIIKDASSNLPNELVCIFNANGFEAASKESKLVLVNPSNKDARNLVLSLITRWLAFRP